MPTSSGLQDNISTPNTTSTTTIASASTTKWMMSRVKSENSSVAPGLGLGLPSDRATSVLTDLMMGPPAIFGGKPTTLDFLGLGMGPDGASSDGISAYLTSMGGGLEVGAAAASPFGGMDLGGSSWDDSPDRKPALL